MKRFDLTLSWRRPLYVETSPLICDANQWTGFYMITAPVKKELRTFLWVRLKLKLTKMIFSARINKYCLLVFIRLIDDWQPWKIRSSRLELFYKKVFLEISENSQENACARVSFLIKLQPSYFPVFGLNTEIYGVNLSEYKKIRDLQLYLKRDSGTGVFLRILRNF